MRPDTDPSLSRSPTNSELVIEYRKERGQDEGYISSYVHKMDQTPSNPESSTDRKHVAGQRSIEMFKSEVRLSSDLMSGSAEVSDGQR